MFHIIVIENTIRLMVITTIYYNLINNYIMEKVQTHGQHHSNRLNGHDTPEYPTRAL